MAVTRSEVAERYAEALFDLSLEEKALETVEKDLTGLGRILGDSAELRRLVASPVFDREQKTEAMLAILTKAGASQTLQNFVAVLGRNGRMRQLPAVIEAFARLAAAHRNEVAAEAISATPLTDVQEQELRTQIEASSGRTVNLTTRVDEGLLGGLIVKVGSKMIDSSLRTRLNRLKQSLKEA